MHIKAAGYIFGGPQYKQCWWDSPLILLPTHVWKKQQFYPLGEICKKVPAKWINISLQNPVQNCGFHKVCSQAIPIMSYNPVFYRW